MLTYEVFQLLCCVVFNKSICASSVIFVYNALSYIILTCCFLVVINDVTRYLANFSLQQSLEGFVCINQGCKRPQVFDGFLAHSTNQESDTVAL